MIAKEPNRQTNIPREADEGAGFSQRHPVAVLLFLLLMICIADNLMHPPKVQPTALAIVALVQAYQDHVSGPPEAFGVCKFAPTCSDYMIMAQLKYGSLKGTAKGIGRILRCSPVTKGRKRDYP